MRSTERNYAGTAGSAAPVHVGAVLDAQDEDGSLVLVDRVHDAVGASTGREMAGELALERLADALGVIKERADYELGDRGGDPLRKSGESALRRRGDAQLPGAHPRR